MSLRPTVKSIMRKLAGSRRSPLERRHQPYFVQRVTVGRECLGRTRLDVFSRICEGRRVLHVGCADWPITDLKANLHVQLDPSCAALDGFDIHPEAFELLRPLLRGSFFSDFSQVTGAYDVVLVPEVLEHLGNLEGFMRTLDQLDATHVVLTVPDAYQCARRHFDYLEGPGTFVEVVHPDHNCWFTPYTLCNVIAKYTPWKLHGIWFFNDISLLAIATKRPGHEGTAPGVL